MKNIEYQIEFYTDWHCGSGLSAGADLDALVIKNKDQLPFVPGKTIKGLLREAIEEIHRLSDNKERSNIEKALGFFEKDKKNNEVRSVRSDCFFEDAALPTNLASAIKQNETSRFLYRTIASTQIDENGTAKDNSLRKMQVTIPVKLQGRILNVPNEFEQDIKQGLQYIKRLGVNRNRGLGRCCFSIQNIEEVKEDIV